MKEIDIINPTNKEKKDNLIQLGHPTSLSKWITEVPSPHKILRIKMTCGGGMGGSSWYEYVKPQEINPTHQIQEFTRINNETIQINTQYIVLIEEYLLLSLKYKTIVHKYRELREEYEKNPHKTIQEQGTTVEIQKLVKNNIPLVLIDEHDEVHY